MNFLNGARWLSGAFTGVINWTPTAARTITLPNDSVTLLGDDRPVGSLGSGVLLRGYEPLVTVAASKVLALTDACTVQVCTAVCTITVPTNATVPYAIGTHIRLRRSTSATVTIAFAVGVTINNELGTTNLLTTVSNFTLLRKIGTDTWVAVNPIHNDANLPGSPTTNTPTVGSNNTGIATTAFADTVANNTVNNLSKIRYLFVLAGESNSGGMALNSTLTSDQLLAQNHLKIWNNTTSTFQPLQIGTNNLISHTGLTDNIQHGIERGIACEVLEVLQYPEAYMVKSGQGSSTIDQWSVGNATNYLSILTTRYNAARTAMINAGFTVRPVLVWFQGINDATAGTVPATWRTATQAHFTQIRSLMGASTPIFMPLIMPTNASYSAINTEINTIDTADVNMWALPTSAIPQNPANAGHYTANGYLRIARSFVDSFRNSLGVPGSFTQGNARHVSSNPIVVIKRNAVLSIVANTDTSVVFDAIDIDTDNLFNASNGTIVIALGSEGIYSITAMCTTDIVQSLRTQILVNNIIRAQSPLTIISTNSIYSTEVTRILRLNSGDIVSMRIFQSNSTNATVNTFTQLEYIPTLSILRVGR